ncbi:MAG: bme8 [Betaproteobacteria bacterium]|nr:bme8 [Betaproteobacteria bacterium]
MQRVIFVNRYFYPDLSATSQILSDLAFYLASIGVDVIVITGRQHYTDAAASLPPRETLRGVQVIRIATTAFGRTHLLGRAFDYMSFYATAFWELIRRIRRRDIVVAKTDPPLMSVVAAFATRLRGARQINWLQDLFPEVALVLEPELLNGTVVRAAQKARDWSLRHAVLNVVLGNLMLKRLRDLGVREDRVVKIPNWADDRAITPVPHERNPLRSEWGLEGKFVVAYSGNLGRAHEFQTIMKAAVLLNGEPEVVFLIIGGGAQLQNVRNFAAIYGLTNIVERPYQARERLALSLGAADVHLITLKPQLEGLIVPSKFYGIAAAQRAIAFIGDAEGEVGALVRQYECGACFQVGDEQGLAQFIRQLAQNRAQAERMGRNARLALEAEWSQEKAFEQWHAALSSLPT